MPCEKKRWQLSEPSRISESSWFALSLAETQVFANGCRRGFAEVEFLESKVGIDFSNALQLDVTLVGVDMIDRHRLFCRIDQDDLLEAVAERRAAHQVGLVSGCMRWARD